MHSAGVISHPVMSDKVNTVNKVQVIPSIILDVCSSLYFTIVPDTFIFLGDLKSQF